MEISYAEDNWSEKQNPKEKRKWKISELAHEKQNRRYDNHTPNTVQTSCNMIMYTNGISTNQKFSWKAIITKYFEISILNPTTQSKQENQIWYSWITKTEPIADVTVPAMDRVNIKECKKLEKYQTLSGNWERYGIWNLKSCP